MHVYPIRFNTTADGSGKGGFIRELRLNPDKVHLGFNAIKFDKDGVGQFGYFGAAEHSMQRPRPACRLSPIRPHQGDSAVRPRAGQAAPVCRSASIRAELVLNPAAQSVGELRGFSKDGKEVTYIGSPDESIKH